MQKQPSPNIGMRIGMPRKRVDIFDGRIFGRLTPLMVPMARRGYLPIVLVCCTCGNYRQVSVYNLKNGTTKSCGCLRFKGYSKTHGMTNSRMYHIYCGMKSRCRNQNVKDYQYYGGRGIKFLISSFEAFREFCDLNGYDDTLTVDRVDPSGHYQLDNIRFISQADQNRNTIATLRITHPVTKETLCASEWSRKLGGEEHLVSARIRCYGWPLERAIMTPVRGSQ